MFEVLNRISLQKFIVLAFSFVGVSFLFVVMATLYLLEAKRFDGIQVDIAGRQRMLNQRFAKETILQTLGSAHDTEDTFSLLVKSANTLLDGGDLQIGDQLVNFPKIENPDLRDLLTSQLKLIAESKNDSELLRKLNLDDQLIRERLEVFNSAINKTHIVANDAVKKFVELGDRKLAILNNLMIFSLLLFVIVVAVVLMSVASRIRRIEEVSSILHRESEGTVKHSNMLNEVTSSLSSTTNELHASIHESVAAIEQMKGMLVSTNQGTTRVHKSTRDIDRSSEELKSILDKLTSSIMSLSKSMHQIESDIVKTEKDSKQSFENVSRIVEEIAKKADVINEIVLKTQLLSFNASIEAVRAGEHGKGFALVAQEVGNLARLTGKSSAEIEELLNSSIKEINVINKAITEQVAITREKVNSGANLASESLTVGNASNEKFSKVRSLISEIGVEAERFLEASHEQMKAIEQVGISMEGIRRATDLNVKATDTNLDVVKQLKHSSTDLKQAFSKLDGAIRGTQIGSKSIIDFSDFNASIKNISNLSQLNENRDSFERVLSKLGGNDTSSTLSESDRKSA